MHNPLLHCNKHLKQLQLSNKIEQFSYKGRRGWCRRMCIKLFKEQLAWAVDKRIQVISTIMLFKNSKTTKEPEGISRFKFKAILYTLLCGRQ